MLEYLVTARSVERLPKFETIHPYSDGNGRIGRALADYVAVQNPIVSSAPFSMSRIIQSDKDTYYSALRPLSRTAPITRMERLINPRFLG